MPANVSSYLGRQPAWNKLGTVTGHYMTWAEIVAHGGINYTVFKLQLEYGGKPIDAYGTFRMNMEDVASGNTDGLIFLGTVGQDYTVIPHQQGFQMVDALVASANGGAHYETAGALGLGERVWGQADLGLAVKVGNDEQKGYLSFLTSYDGSVSHQYRLNFTRIVCQNTWNAAIGEKTRAKLIIRHTKNAQVRLDEAHEALTYLNAETKTVEQKLNFLAGRRMTRESMTSIMDRLFPKTKKDDDGNLVDTTRRQNLLAEILECYESNDRDAFPEFRGSAYNLLNAVVEHTDHLRGTELNRPLSAMFGSGDKLKTQAMEVILQQSNGLPMMGAASGIGGLLGAVVDATGVN